MSRVTVSTGTKTKKANDITEELLSGDIALIERGKAELYHEMIDRFLVDIDLAIIPALPTIGGIAMVTESAINKTYSGIIQSFSLSISEDAQDIGIMVEVPVL